MVDNFIDYVVHNNVPLRNLADILENYPTRANCADMAIILARRLAKVEKQLRKHDNEIAGLWEYHNGNI